MQIIGAILYGGVIVFFLASLILGFIWGWEDPGEVSDE